MIGNDFKCHCNDALINYLITKGKRRKCDDVGATRFMLTWKHEHYNSMM